MAVVSFLKLILLFLICCIIGQGEGNSNRQRRQAIGGNNRDVGISSRDSDGSMLANNLQYGQSNNPNMVFSNNPNNQQQSQGQSQIVRSRGYYSSPDFKPPPFSGEKPVGWFDTKYPNWVSNQNTKLANNVVNGRDGAPSSLQAKAILPKREDGGPLAMEKVANYYASRGEKAYDFNQFNNQKHFGSICTNRQNFNGYTFGKFRCPLPPGTGMNQQDQYCCGRENNQYCCNAQEFSQNDDELHGHHGHHGKHRYPKHYSPSSRRALAIILPIVGLLVAAGAAAIVFLYYKNVRKSSLNQNKGAGAARSKDNYSAVPQNPPVEKPRESQPEPENV